MSDRVLFTLESSALVKTDMLNLLRTVFDIEPTRTGFKPWEDIDIICRFDQFARFIIVRNDLGLTNNIKNLNAKIISDPSIPVRRIYNVSKHEEPSND